MSNMTKSRSWTFPVCPSPAVAVALVPFAGCHDSFLAFDCLTFVRMAAYEAVSPREEDSDAEGHDAAEGEVVAAAVLEVQYFVLEVHGGFLEVHCSFLVVQYSASEVGCGFLAVQYSALKVGCGFLAVQYSALKVHCHFLEVQHSEREQLP